MNQRPFGPQPVHVPARCVSARPRRLRRPQRLRHRTHQTHQSVPKWYLERSSASHGKHLSRGLGDTAREMSQENLEIVRQTMDAANRRDLQTMDELVSEDLEFHSTFAASEGRVFRGHQGIREYFVSLEESFDDLRLDAEEVIDAGGDRVVLLVWVSGRGKGSAIPVRHRYGRCGPCPLERSDRSTATGILPRPSKPPGYRSSR